MPWLTLLLPLLYCRCLGGCQLSAIARQQLGGADDGAPAVQRCHNALQMNKKGLEG
jgi:hypothetical protein